MWDEDTFGTWNPQDKKYRRVMTEQIRSIMKGCLVMASYIFTYFPQCMRERKVTVRWNPNRKSRSLKMVSKCYIASSSPHMRLTPLVCY